jgi:hypothetical protein
MTYLVKNITKLGQDNQNGSLDGRESESRRHDVWRQTQLRQPYEFTQHGLLIAVGRATSLATLSLHCQYLSFFTRIQIAKHYLKH